jgi:hypothetical protein
MSAGVDESMGLAQRVGDCGVVGVKGRRVDLMPLGLPAITRCERIARDVQAAWRIGSLQLLPPHGHGGAFVG